MSFLQTSVSGARAGQSALSTTAANIAEAQSIGYKPINNLFSTMVAGTGSNTVPSGTRYQAVQDLSPQGIFQESNSNTDFSINGNGFIVTSATQTPIGLSYTRAGSCLIDEDGYLINRVTGGYVLGYTNLDTDGNVVASVDTSLTSSLTPIKVGQGISSAQATQNLNIVANLPSTDLTTSAARIVNTSIQDSLAANHTLSFSWQRTAITPSTWTMAVTSPDGAITKNGVMPAGTAYSVTVVFDANGMPASFDGNATPPAMLCTWNVAVTNANPTLVNLNAGTVAKNNGLTCFNSDYNPTYTQDASGYGVYKYMTIDKQGRVLAAYNNGSFVTIGLLALANFTSPNQLQAQSNTSFAATSDSGSCILGLPGTQSYGNIVPNTLESSNVDLPNEIGNLIIFNQFVQANYKAMSTAKENFSSLMQVV